MSDLSEIVKVRPVGVENPGSVGVEQLRYDFNKVTGCYLMPKRHAMLLQLAMPQYQMMTPEKESVRLVEEAAQGAFKMNAEEAAAVKRFEARMKLKYPNGDK